jgi:serine/threonine-protein kinase
MQEKVIANRYQLLDLLGEGGFGSVYRAYDMQNKQEVAIKILHFDANKKPEQAQRFQIEAHITAALQHPNILRVFELGQTSEGKLYMVTELLVGAPLDEILTIQVLNLPQTFYVLRQATLALKDAHDKAVIHRDIKPGNLFIHKEGNREVVKLLDFGIAKVLHQDQKTLTGQLFGTPYYMSPEQIYASKSITKASDIYSLGAVAYHCLTGRVPFDGDSQYMILNQHINSPLPQMGKISLLLDHPALQSFIEYLMAKKPEQRPQDATVVLDKLNDLQRQYPHWFEPIPTFLTPNLLNQLKTKAAHPSQTAAIMDHFAQTDVGQEKSPFHESDDFESEENTSQTPAINVAPTLNQPKFYETIEEKITKRKKSNWLQIAILVFSFSSLLFYWLQEQNQSSKKNVNTSLTQTINQMQQKNLDTPIVSLLLEDAFVEKMPELTPIENEQTEPDLVFDQNPENLNGKSEKEKIKAKKSNQIQIIDSNKSTPKKIDSTQKTTSTNVGTDENSKNIPTNNLKNTNPSESKPSSVHIVIKNQKSSYKPGDRIAFEVQIKDASAKVLNVLPTRQEASPKNYVQLSAESIEISKDIPLSEVGTGKVQIKSCFQQICDDQMIIVINPFHDDP